MHREALILDHVIILAAIRDGHWRPGIGDPTILGRVTVVAYFVAAVACGRVWRLELRAMRIGDRTAGPTFWLILTMLLASLGGNKQLDLQTLLTHLARSLARSQGWYERRREVQVAFIAVVGLVALVATVAFAWIVRKNLERDFMALVGIALLMAFVVIRTASLYHVDDFINTTLAGVRWNAIMELGGIGLTGLGAFMAMRFRRAKRSGSRA